MAENTIWKVTQRMGLKGRHTPLALRAAAVGVIQHVLGFREEGKERAYASISEQADAFQHNPEAMQAWADYLDGLRGT